MPRGVRFHARLLALVAALLSGAAGDVIAQQSPGSPDSRTSGLSDSRTYPYEFDISSVPMLRNAQFFSAAGELTDRGITVVLDATTGHLFEKRGAKGVLARIAHLWFVDMPVASLAQVYTHEYGHITRHAGDFEHSVTIEHWPWPVPFAGPRLRGTSRGWTLDESVPFLAGVAGGSEASHVLADELIDRVYATDRASYFDVTLYVYGKLDPSAYAIAYSGPSRPDTDPWVYALDLSYARARPLAPWPEDPAVLFGSIRTGAWLNLLDYALVGNIEGVIAEYVIGGRPVLRPRWLKIGPIRVVPGFNYTPTPRGQQYRINCRVGVPAATANVYVRWTQSLKADSVDALVQQWNDIYARRGVRTRLVAPNIVPLLGIGGEWSWAGVHGMAPTIRADLWREIDRQVAGRAEVGLALRHRAFGQGRGFRFAAGGKSAGYLPGFPEASGFYVIAGLLVDF